MPTKMKCCKTKNENTVFLIAYSETYLCSLQVIKYQQSQLKVIDITTSVSGSNICIFNDSMGLLLEVVANLNLLAVLSICGGICIFRISPDCREVLVS